MVGSGGLHRCGGAWLLGTCGVVVYDIAVVAVGGDVWHSCVGGWGDTAGGGLSTRVVVSTGWLRWCQPVAAGRTPRRESNFKRPGVISCNLNRPGVISCNFKRPAREVSSPEILMHGGLV